MAQAAQPGATPPPDLPQQVIDALDHPVYVIDVQDYTLQLANEAARAHGPITLGETTCYELTHDRSTPCDGDHPCPLAETINTGEAARTEHIHYDQQGHPHPVEVYGHPLRDASGQITHMVEYALDLSERKALETQAAIGAQVFRRAGEAIMVTDTQGRITHVNDAFCQLTGYPETEARGRTPGQLLHSGEQGPAFYRELWHRLKEEGVWEGEIWNRARDGRLFPEWLTITTVFDVHGQPARYIGMFRDISTQKQKEERLSQLASVDSLTGLANRAAWEEKLGAAVARARRGETGISILFLDLDGFKAINDHYGHPAGDRILRETTQRIQAQVRAADTVARLGGDEIVVLLEDIGLEGGERVAQALLQALEAPFHLEEGTVQLGVSIGVVNHPAQSDMALSAAGLISLCDQTMYAAKASGGHTYRIANIGSGT